MITIKSRACIVSLVFGLAILAGCASTKVTEQTPMAYTPVARPNQIWVYDFVGDPAQIPADSAIRNDISAPDTPPTAEQLETSRRLGALIADKLIEDIQAMGFSAAHGGPGSQVGIGDGVIRGYLVSVQSGGPLKRFVIGFGYGAAEMDTVVEGYVMTPQGLRKLGSGTLSSSGNKAPGAIVPAAVTIATGNPIGLIVIGSLKVLGEASGRNTIDARAKATADEIANQLKIRFQDRGWIS